MNIFFLDQDPKVCAQQHGDKHVVKMVLETVQLLSTAHRVLDGDTAADALGAYKSTHKNHPSAIWVRQSADHYTWAWRLALHLVEEFTYRRGKEHGCKEKMFSLAKLPVYIPSPAWSDPPQCMPLEFKHENTVQAYRNYYVDKARQGIVQYNWNPERKPEWLKQ